MLLADCFTLFFDAADFDYAERHMMLFIYALLIVRRCFRHDAAPC